jgi:hypothetical protein
MFVSYYIITSIFGIYNGEVLLTFFCFPTRLLSMSPNARMARIASLETMLSMSSNALVAMASQLTEAEERERASIGRGRWNHLRSMGDAKNLLHYMFNAASEARCLYNLAKSLIVFRPLYLAIKVNIKHILIFCKAYWS